MVPGGTILSFPVRKGIPFDIAWSPGPFQP